MRKMLSVMALFVVSLLLVSSVSVSALDDANFDWSVEVNGDTVGVFSANGAGADQVYSVSVEEGQKLDVEVTLATKKQPVENIEVSAAIKGYEYSEYEPLSASTALFNMVANTQKTVKLNLNLPKKLDKQVYWLHLNVDNSNSPSVSRVVKLNVEPPRHGVDIADVTLFPGTTVKAGRSLQPTVLLQNFGDKDENDVKVTVAIPALGVSASKFVDVLKTEKSNIDYEDVEEMFLPLPANAAEGDYDVKVTAQYDDLRETVTKTVKLHVVADAKFQGGDKLVLAVGPQTQTVNAGQSAVYGVALSNNGAAAKAYTLEAVSGDWAAVSFSDNLVVLEPGKNKVVYATVAVNSNAAAGNHVASVAVKSGSDVVETVALNTNVVAGSAASGVNLRNGLEIALIVLVVLLVLIGLIIGFSKLRKDNDEEQTYY